MTLPPPQPTPTPAEPGGGRPTPPPYPLFMRLDALQERLAWITDADKRAEWTSRFGPEDEPHAERDRLLSDMEEVLDKLDRVGGKP